MYRVGEELKSKNHMMIRLSFNPTPHKPDNGNIWVIYLSQVSERTTTSFIGLDKTTENEDSS